MAMKDENRFISFYFFSFFREIAYVRVSIVGTYLSPQRRETKLQHNIIGVHVPVDSRYC